MNPFGSAPVNSEFGYMFSFDDKFKDMISEISEEELDFLASFLAYSIRETEIKINEELNGQK